jgi:hypothetical protein
LKLNPILIAAGLALLPPAAHAARPMVTDDARITDPQSCQIETWTKSTRAGREYWAFPACNPTGNLEWTLGGNTLPDGTGGHVGDYLLQGKTLFRQLETNDFAWGLAAGIIRHGDPLVGQDRTSATYFYVPISASFADDRLIIHVNVGAQDNRDTDSKPVTYGLGSEINLTQRFALIVETYGDNRTRQYFQGGVRIWIVPGRFQIDATRGAQSGDYGGSNWWTIGLRLISPAFIK